MMRKLLLCSSISFLLLAPVKSALSDELISEAVMRSMNTALVFLKPEAALDRRSTFFKDELLKTEVGPDEKDDSFVVNLPPNEVRDYLSEKFDDIVDHVEANPVYYLFPAECATPSNLPTSAYTPPGITRVGGPLQGQVPARKVWIIDSGIDVDSTLLTIDFTNAALCTPTGCESATADHSKVADEIGHGTFIAGIIAGKVDASGSIVGMLPGATVVPIKVFSPNSPPGNFRALNRAVRWITPLLGKGDVVNMSWGASVDPENAGHPYTNLEKSIRAMADAGAKISVAAGNYDATDGLASTGGYVELVTPARIGGYRPSSNGGGIVTVSAVDGSDNFWFHKGASPFGSAFGNGNRPSFAAPGVDITSLWPGNFKNTCTGTSFATAHVSGALLQSKDDIVLEVDGPSASNVDGEADKIVACKKTMGICHIIP